MANQIGRVMEDLTRAMGASAHLFRDLRIGEGPGEVNVRNDPHPDFQNLAD